jgi:hypothetical protein
LAGPYTSDRHEIVWWEDRFVAESSTIPNLGFLTVIQEQGGYLGGYLVTNSWGRPLEFRLSTAVQPNRVQQILYGGTLKPYVFADLIGKTLVEKTPLSVQFVVTDCEPLLDLRLHCSMPVAWFAATEDKLTQAMEQAGAGIRRLGSHPLICHPRYLDDADAIRPLLDRCEVAVDLAEPFGRIREALGEARKLGVVQQRN